MRPQAIPRTVHTSQTGNDPCARPGVFAGRRIRGGSCRTVPRVLTIFPLLLSLVGCGSPFRAPERVRIPTSSPHDRASGAGLSVSATMITDEDLLFELFRANLRLAGVLPIYLEMRNDGGAPVRLRGIEVEAHDAMGHRLAWISPEDVLERLHDYYGVRLYRPASKKELQERFKHIGFPFDHPLRPGQDREGFLFFQLPKSQHPLEAIEAVTLRLGGIRSPEQGEVSLELTLRSRASQEKPDKSATSR